VTLVPNTIEEEAPSWQFGEIHRNAVADAAGARDRGVCAQDVYLRRADRGRLSEQRRGATKLIDPDIQQTIAQGVCDAVVADIEYADPAFAEI